jgi:hypothetical protein
MLFILRISFLFVSKTLSHYSQQKLEWLLHVEVTYSTFYARQCSENSLAIQTKKTESFPSSYAFFSHTNFGQMLLIIVYTVNCEKILSNHFAGVLPLSKHFI